jgi:hypothetical protein
MMGCGYGHERLITILRVVTQSRSTLGWVVFGASDLGVHKPLFADLYDVNGPIDAKGPITRKTIRTSRQRGRRYLTQEPTRK